MLLQRSCTIAAQLRLRRGEAGGKWQLDTIKTNRIPFAGVRFVVSGGEGRSEAACSRPRAADGSFTSQAHPIGCGLASSLGRSARTERAADAGFGGSGCRLPTAAQSGLLQNSSAKIGGCGLAASKIDLARGRAGRSLPAAEARSSLSSQAGTPQAATRIRIQTARQPI